MKFLFNGIEIDSKVGAPDLGIFPEVNGFINIPVQAGDELKLANKLPRVIGYYGTVSLNCTDNFVDPKEYRVYLTDDGKLALPLALTKPNATVIEKFAYDDIKAKLEKVTRELDAVKSLQAVLGESGLYDETDLFKAQLEIANEKIKDMEQFDPYYKNWEVEKGAMVLEIEDLKAQLESATKKLSAIEGILK